MHSSVEACLIGSGVIARRQALVARVGIEAYRAGLARVPAALRQAYETATSISWVPIATVEAVADAAAREAGHDPEDLHDLTVRDATEHQFRTMWRVMLRFTSDEALVSRTPIMFSKTRNVGRLVSEISSPGRADIVLSGWPRAPERSVRTVAIGMETVLRLAGRRDVKVAYKVTREGATFVATWRV